MINKIENENMSEVLKSEYAVIDFSAEWCGPCRMLAPVLEELSDELDGKVDFFNADVDDNPELAGQCGISSIPALVFFKGGKPVGVSVGFKPKEMLRDTIAGELEIEL